MYWASMNLCKGFGYKSFSIPNNVVAAGFCYCDILNSFEDSEITYEILPFFGFPSMIVSVWLSTSIKAVHRVYSVGPENVAKMVSKNY